MAGVRPRCSRGPMLEPALTRRGHCTARWRQNWSVVILSAYLWTNGATPPTADQRQHPRQVRCRVLWHSSSRPAAPRAAAVVRRCSAGTPRATAKRMRAVAVLDQLLGGRPAAGPQVTPCLDRRARTGRTARPRSTKKIIARRKQTNFRNNPGREARVGPSWGLQVLLVMKLGLL